MSLTDRLFGRAAGAPLALAVVRTHLAESVRRAAAPDPELTRARFADGCRDAALAPVLPEQFDQATAGLEGEGWRRLAVLVGALELPPVRGALPQTQAGRSAEGLLAALAGLACDTPLLTIEVLEQSELRAEELSRRLIAALGAQVSGEKLEESRLALHRLDYGRLLAEAERARQAAADRAARLHAMQEEQEQRRTRRGKH